MSLDKLVDSTQLDSDLTAVANAIRTKGGTSGQLAFPAGFMSAIGNIPTGTTPTGTKQINITENGTTTEDVAAYASAQITVNVPTGGGSGVQGDTETMTDSQASFTATVTGTLTHFLIVASEAYANNTGTRTHLVYADSSGRLYGMRTNSGATAYSGTPTTVSVTFSANAITITVPANQAFAGGDYLWFAW